MSEVNLIIHRLNVLVSKSPKERDHELMKQCSRLQFRGLTSNKQTSFLFSEFTQQLDKSSILKELWILEFMIKLGTELYTRNEIKDSFWVKILNVNFPRNMPTSDTLVRVLLDSGLSRNIPCAWQNVALLTKIFCEVSDYRCIITSLLKNIYAKTIGQLLDSINDFQLCNYLVELLSNVFPRKSATKPGVVSPPKLWEDEAKNLSIFDDEEYPYRGKHGDPEVISFIWKRFGPFFTNLVRATSARYIVGNNRMRQLSKAERFYIQVINHKVYLWDCNGLFLQLEAVGIEACKDANDHVRLNLLKPFTEVVSSPHLALISSMGNAKGFQLEFDSIECGEMFIDSTKIPKISEVQSFIALNFISSFDDEMLDSSMPVPEMQVDIVPDNLLRELSNGLEYNAVSDAASDNEKNPPVVLHNMKEKDGGKYRKNYRSDNISTSKANSNSLVTPEQTVHKPPIEDEWDLNLSNSTGNRLEIRSVNTPDYKDFQDIEDEMDIEDEQSPLVMAQKRRLARANSKTHETSTRDSSISNTISPSHSIRAKIDEHLDTNPSSSKLKIMDKKLCSVSRPGKGTEEHLQNTKLSNKPECSKGKNSKVNSKYNPNVDVGLNALEDIFAIPATKPKRQQKQNNHTNGLQVSSKNATAGGHVRITRSKEKQAALNMKRRRVDHEDTKSLFPEGRIPDADTVAASNNETTPANASTITTTPKTPEKVTKTRILRKNPHHKKPKLDIELPSPRSAKHRSQYDKAQNRTEKSNGSVHKQTEKGFDIRATANISMRNDISESTTLFNTSAIQDPLTLSYTNKLQEQIFNSINSFSNDLARKISIINEEMNNKIIHELSEKYQRVFKDLQISFQQDINGMSRFISEFKDLLHLPEEELVNIIRNKQFS
ncbi:HCL026Cp [Eremothecium sinecaudum]|uniref:HCL026Cp n=1 Tax=Eremothecium sinecaudum TaxID=45286 RepID=A0A0X8HRI9_9SACH|nr:HCL026Cp [Eremothecium sinecaudum]AMD20125.1 HCL026Cp [Eremothecium sinecaudum]